ncbi:unnamed protein product [Candidula unifasciata]|uniref:Cytokine-inducible SH2-containing protein n=1 Tax=Candidula unifasciata TaxID=100452 RepID=A0A8S3ZIT7_9EUPU|nr:unnamed protein product [Candidula unifasciata]
MPPSSCPFTSDPGVTTPVDVNSLKPAAKEEQLCQDLVSPCLQKLIAYLRQLSICSDNCIDIIKNCAKVDQVKETSAQPALSHCCTHLCPINESLRWALQQEPKQDHNCLQQTSPLCSLQQDIRNLQHGMALHGSDNHHEEPQNDSGYGSGIPPAHRHYHRPCFNSQIDLEKLEKNYSELLQCGFYFGSIDSQTSKDLLQKTPTGTFLIRDSSHSGYLYTLSVKTERGATSVRILYHKGLFQFDSDERIRNKLPQFDSVLGLVDFHVMVTSEGGNKSWQWEEMSGHRSMKATLTKPLKSSVPSLAHLSRVKINQCLNNAYLSPVVDTLPLVSNREKEFMKEYPYRI